MMLMRDLLAPWFHYSGPEAITRLTLDSREVKTGSLFVALPGHQVDGRQYVAKAFEQGAVAALIHTDNPDEQGKVSHTPQGVEISFFQLNRQVSALAAQFNPVNASKLSVIGITGTNGKTSVSQLIAQLVQLMGHNAAVMGTLGNGLWGDLVDSGNTTADAITIMQHLAQYQAAGASVCAMEVSSHGLVQGRVEAVPFKIAVFTNLSRDHLDYHGDMASYGAAKRRLFQFSQLHAGLINLDDEVGKVWFKEMDSRQIQGFSANNNRAAQFYCHSHHYHERGVDAQIVWPEGEAAIASPLLGAFNLSNLLAAVSALYIQGYEMANILACVPHLVPVVGRMERFSTPKGVTLVVDYAHTPDAIEQALQALRVHCDGTLWCVFGCGGDRDKGKRPLMASSAERFADKVMVTSDNARSEAPEAIIADILQGLSVPEKALTQVDRIQAIKQVVSLAKAGDIILLAGKGHETYQEVAGVRHDYDERALARELTQVAL